MPATHLHTTAAILAIGDELAIGQKLDTNTQWLSTRLTDLGIRVVEHTTCADDLERMVTAMRRLADEVNLIISTGGLGPTADDLTRPALARLLGEELITDQDALVDLESRFRARNREVTPNQRLQTQRPPSATMLGNPVGTAPGLHATIGQGPASYDVFCLPGPPREMHPMFEGHVRPRLRAPADRAIRTRVLHMLGMPEAGAAQRLGDQMHRDANPTVGTTASGGVVSVRIRYEGPARAAKGAVENAERATRAALDPFIFGAGDDTPESVTLNLLHSRSERLVTVESCTGGMLGESLTEIAGASDVYLGGWITYADDSKSLEVGVPTGLLEAHGAVSEPVARAMAQGALATDLGAQAHHALAITGIAGPGGGSEAKPVGTVFVARASKGQPTDIRRFLITGDRHDIRDRSAKSALTMLLFHLRGIDAPKLLWQLQA